MSLYIMSRRLRPSFTQFQRFVIYRFKQATKTFSRTASTDTNTTESWKHSFDPTSEGLETVEAPAGLHFLEEEPIDSLIMSDAVYIWIVALLPPLVFGVVLVFRSLLKAKERATERKFARQIEAARRHVDKVGSMVECYRSSNLDKECLFVRSSV